MEESIYEFSQEELTKLSDAIVWTALLAAVHEDGVISESERAEAIKLTHIRTFNTREYIKPIYQYLEKHFEARFNEFHEMLGLNDEDNRKYIERKIQECLEILDIMDQFFVQRFLYSLESFYKHIFHADSTVLQYFAFPVISAHLKKVETKGA